MAPVGQARGPSFSPKGFLSKTGAAEQGAGQEGGRGRSTSVPQEQCVPPCWVHCPPRRTVGPRTLPPASHPPPRVSARPRRLALQTKNTSVPGASESPDLPLVPGECSQNHRPRAGALPHTHLCKPRAGTPHTHLCTDPPVLGLPHTHLCTDPRAGVPPHAPVRKASPHGPRS